MTLNKKAYKIKIEILCKIYNIMSQKQTSKQNTNLSVLSSQKYKGKHIVMVKDKIFASKTGQEIFPLQGVAQESQRQDYFYNHQALASLPKNVNKAVICFDEKETWDELARRRQKPEDQAVVLGLNHSLDQLNESNLRKLMICGIREFVISIDNPDQIEKQNLQNYSFEAILVKLYAISKMAQEIDQKRKRKDDQEQEITVKLRTPDPNKKGKYLEKPVEEIMFAGLDDIKDMMENIKAKLKKELEFDNKSAYMEVYKEVAQALALPVRPPEYLAKAEDLGEIDFLEISKQDIKDHHQRLVLEKFARLIKRLRGLHIALNSEPDSQLSPEDADRFLAGHFVDLLRKRLPEQSKLKSQLNKVKNLTGLFRLKLEAENYSVPIKPVLDRIAGIKAKAA